MSRPRAWSETALTDLELVPRAPLPEPPFLVTGLGRAGQAAVRVLAERFGADLVRAWDADTSAGMQRVRHRLEAEGIRTTLAPRASRRDVGFARTVVKSPGIPFSSQVIDRAVGRQRLVIDELELGWRLTHTPVLAITGTNGKSTVCGLARALLRRAGHRVELAGNTEFGEPLSVAALRPLDWIVCEVSSYQLEGCVSTLPEIGVFTNLTLEHLGRHRTIERYGRMKRRLFINREGCVPRAVIDIDTSFGAQLAVDIERRGGMVVRVGSARAADYRVVGRDRDSIASPRRVQRSQPGGRSGPGRSARDCPLGRAAGAQWLPRDPGPV
jgi:UDP-N-acetylmuramoylalanine-D-glutamate ligase